LTTSKKKSKKLVYVQFHLDGIVLTTQIAADSIEDATATGRTMRLTDVINLAGAEWIDGDVRVTGVFES